MTVHSDHYALVVGIDDYPDFSGLHGAKNDANAFAKWLLNTDTGGGVPETNLKLVLSAPEPARPIQDDIDEALKNLFDTAKDQNAKRLYIYFSGHGVAHTAFSTNLCLAKWSKRRTGAALDSMNYLECAKETGVFDEIVMFMDCCRTRTHGRNALNYQFPAIRPGDRVSGVRTFLGYATEFMLAAHEATVTNAQDIADTEDNDNSEEVRGHFTRALIEALEGQAAQPEGGVTASRLKTYLENRTSAIAQAASHRQKSEIQNGLNSTPEPLFGSALPPAPAPTGNVTINISFGANRTGDMAFEDGDLNSLKDGQASSGPWEISGLRRGNYAIVDRGKNEFESVRLVGDEQGVVNVEFE